MLCEFCNGDIPHYWREATSWETSEGFSKEVCETEGMVITHDNKDIIICQKCYNELEK